MKILTLQEPGKLIAGEAPQPGPPPDGSALVRIHRVGICGTDIHAYSGRQPFFTYPRIPGHELAVEIIEVAENPAGLQAGDRCSVEPYLNCGKCIACRRNRGNCCTALQVLGVHCDGGMRELIHIPIAKLHKSTTLTYDQLALVEPLGIGAHAVSRASLEPGETALVIGCGPIGLAVIQFARAAGAKVIVMDVNPSRLDFCRKAMAIDTTLQPSDPATTAAELADLNGGDLPTAVFDATGHPASMASAFQFPAHGGRLIFVGLFQGEVTFHDPDFHKRELSLLASRNAHSTDFATIIRMIETGAVDTNPWVTHRAHFDDVPESFPLWTQPESGVIKAMVEVS